MGLIQVEHCNRIVAGEIITVQRVGNNFSVYLEPATPDSRKYINCAGPGSLHNVHPDLRLFQAGRKYKVMRMDSKHAWLLDLAVPQYMRLPEGV